MTDYIFSSGSCLKKNLYDTILNLFTNNGWTNISTNERLDSVVLSSPGTEGNRNLILQLRPNNGGDVATDVRTTDGHIMGLRLIKEYVPATNITAGVYELTFGAATVTLNNLSLTYSASGNGTSNWRTAEHLVNLINVIHSATLGLQYTAAVVDATKISLTQRPTYEGATTPTVTGTGASVTTRVEPVTSAGTSPRRTGEAWRVVHLVPAAATTVLNRETVVINYKYHVNANRLILMLEYPSELNLGRALYYIGIPDEVYSAEGGSNGLLFAVSCAGPGATSVAVTDFPSEYTPSSVSVAETVQSSLTPKNPNAAGKYILSEMYYGSAFSGMRGKLTGIFTLPTQNILSGDIIQEGAKQFQVFFAQSYLTTSFSTSAFAIQIA